MAILDSVEDCKNAPPAAHEFGAVGQPLMRKEEVRRYGEVDSGTSDAGGPLYREYDAPQYHIGLPPEPHNLRLFQKIFDVTNDIGPIQKNGYNSFQKYYYVKEEDVVNRVRVIAKAHKLGIKVIHENPHESRHHSHIQCSGKRDKITKRA